MAAFGIGIWRFAGTRPRLRAVGAVITVLGILSLPAVPLASMQMRGTEQGVAGAVHLATGSVAVLLLLIAIGLAATTFGQRFAIYSLATVALLLGFGVWSGLDGPRIAEGLATPWVGLKERISVYSYQLWLVALAVMLLAERAEPRALGLSQRG